MGNTPFPFRTHLQRSHAGGDDGLGFLSVRDARLQRPTPALPREDDLTSFALGQLVWGLFCDGGDVDGLPRFGCDRRLGLDLRIARSANASQGEGCRNIYRNDGFEEQGVAGPTYVVHKLQ